MAELNISKRVRFARGAQRLFIETCRKRLRLTNKELASLLRVSSRTVTDWKREKFLVDLASAQRLSKESRVPMPRNIRLQDRYWYVKKGARKGGVIMYQKYGRVGGDPEIRKRKWHEWWQKIGKHEDHPIFRPLSFRKPARSIQLAEFMGIMMGDGGMSKWQLVVTLHHRDDLAYSRFVRKLIEKLFGVRPSVYHSPRDSVNDIAVSRVGLTRRLHELGLPIGNKVKQQFDIPKWIIKDKKFRIACVRGLVDTDGSVIIHRYRSCGRWYVYPKIDFTSRSLTLLQSVSSILHGLHITHRENGSYSLRIESQEMVRRYFDVVGTSNPKHLKKYQAYAKV